MLLSFVELSDLAEKLCTDAKTNESIRFANAVARAVHASMSYYLDNGVMCDRFFMLRNTLSHFVVAANGYDVQTQILVADILICMHQMQDM